jgi:erythromycin esterase-like protein
MLPDETKDGTMGARKTLDLAAAIRDTAHPVTGAATDYDPLLELIGDTGFVLIGEASHGTHEFYRQRAPQLERAIGLIYLPETERWSHYFHARLADQFDAVIHIDETWAAEPLERTAGWKRGELPEMFPTGQ